MQTEDWIVIVLCLLLIAFICGSFLIAYLGAGEYAGLFYKIMLER